jgi:outer membrane protein assembly factor BamA
VEKDIKKLIEKLSLSLSEALSNSAEIREIVQQIKKRGYNLLLFLEAKIALSKKADTDSSFEEKVEQEIDAESTISLESKISPEDREFLRSIKIKINGNN